MTIKKLNQGKLPIVRIEKKLNKLADKDLFPEKLEQANETLLTAELPKKQRKTSSSNLTKGRAAGRFVRS